MWEQGTLGSLPLLSLRLAPSFLQQQVKLFTVPAAEFFISPSGISCSVLQASPLPASPGCLHNSSEPGASGLPAPTLQSANAEEGEAGEQRTFERGSFVTCYLCYVQLWKKSFREGFVAGASQGLTSPRGGQSSHSKGSRAAWLRTALPRSQ